MSATMVARNPGEGQAFWMLGGLFEVLLSSDESDGAATIMRMTFPTGMGPPPHTHPGTETVYVLEGALSYHIGDEVLDAKAGSLFHIPADTLEWFEPTSEAKVLITYSPGGIEKFFAEAGEPAERREVPPPPTSPPDVERLVEIGARYGIKIQPPPEG